MNFSYNENQKMIADMVQQFGRQHITPYVRQWDDNQIFPVEVFKKLGDLGLMGVLVPGEYGGSGFSYTEYVTAIQELSILDPSIGLSMAAHNSLCTGHILQFGNGFLISKANEPPIKPKPTIPIFIILFYLWLLQFCVHQYIEKILCNPLHWIQKLYLGQ